MTLSDSQIERYSRQIIVPEVGARGQERLLAARLVIAGEIGDLAPVLAYMAGAGVGKIFVRAELDRSRAEQTIAGLSGLNPDATVASAGDWADPADLILILLGSAYSLNLARSLSGAPRSSALILARLDAPGRIAVMTSASPCPRCAGLLTPLAARSGTAGFITMVAAVEAFKILTRRTPDVSALLEFDGYRCVARELEAGPARCGCAGGDPKLR